MTEDAPSWTYKVWDPEERIVRIGYGLAQYMYTPSDIETSEFIEDDRPYGGWLYFEALVVSRDDRQMDLVGVNVGVTGEESLSGDTQKLIHELTDSQRRTTKHHR